ncbi:Mitochondrial import inner membrane translocase subunit tim21-like protein [Elsinoe fawcettii]|nr:Mitochondrial import inner membrane translocase subunit tim21-like protein [Elsinoe fawcettii]
MPPPRIRLLSPSLLRPHHLLSRPLLTRPATTTSSSSPSPKRKSITLTTDTGRVPWTALSPLEKATRSTQQSFNFLLVLAGLTLTCGVSYVLYLEVFSPSSKTAVFNSVVARIRSDPRCVDILVGDDPERRKSIGTRVAFWRGKGGEIEAHGEGSWSRWARNRVVSSRTEKDRAGRERMYMHFYVSGPKGEGTVWVQMVRGEGGWEEWYLALEPEGSGERIVLEDKKGKRDEGMKGGKMFGVRWWTVKIAGESNEMFQVVQLHEQHAAGHRWLAPPSHNRLGYCSAWG